MIQIGKSVPDFAREPKAFHLGSGQPVFELPNAALGKGEAVNNAADQQEEGGNQNPETNAKRRFHIHGASASSLDDSATSASFEDCASAMPDTMTGSRCCSTLKIRPGCQRRSRLPVRTGQPLITGMVSNFSIYCSVLPLIILKPLRTSTRGSWHAVCNGQSQSPRIGLQRRFKQ